MKTKKPDEKHYQELTKRGLTRNAIHSDYDSLKLRLLDIGGWSVILPRIEEDYSEIMDRGRKFAGKSITKRGMQSQCHRNSANLWDANRNKLKICTGYALSKDGIWRQHSWCVMRTKRSWRVVETTTKRIQYYGYIMNEDESELFLYGNE
jgi:hypothetical protein